MNKNFTNIRKNQFLAIVSGIITTVAMLFTSIFVKNIIDKLSAGFATEIKKDLVSLAVLICINLVFNYIFQYNYRLISNIGSYQLKNSYFKNFLKLNYFDIKKLNSGSVMVSLTDDTVKISQLYGEGVVNISVQISMFLTTMGIMFYYNKVVAVSSFLVVLVGIKLTNRISNKISENTVLLQQAHSAEQEQILQTTEGIRTVKQLGKEKYFSDLYSNALNVNKKYAKEVSKYFSLYATIFTFIANIVPVLTIFLSVIYVARGTMTIGSMVGVMSVVGGLTEPVTGIGQFMSQRKIAKSLIKKNKQLERGEKKEETEDTDESNSFEELSFYSRGYNFGEKTVLENVKFNITKNHSYLIKGKSGVGKSTIFDIIMKFLPENEVEVLFNGKNLKDISSSTLYKNILLIDQKVITINASILENITLGDHYSSSDMEDVLEVCQLSDLVKEKGLTYMINAKGDNVSGGEKQRISIARVLIRTPQLLLLDEPTSALDKKTEKRFAENLVEYTKKRNITLIVVAHSDVFDELVDQCFVINEPSQMHTDKI